MYREKRPCVVGSRYLLFLELMDISTNEALHKDTALLLVVLIPEELISNEGYPVNLELFGLRFEIALTFKDGMIELA